MKMKKGRQREESERANIVHTVCSLIIYEYASIRVCTRRRVAQNRQHSIKYSHRQQESSHKTGDKYHHATLRHHAIIRRSRRRGMLLYVSTAPMCAAWIYTVYNILLL